MAERIAAHIESDAAAHPPPPPPDNAAKGTSLWESTPETAVSRRRKMTGGLHGRGGLFEQAGAALQRRLAADPHDAEALLRLADLHRGEGRLDAALLGEGSYANLLAMLTPETWPDPGMFHYKQLLHHRCFAGRQTLISSTYNFLLCVFRPKPITDSGATRSPIPAQADH